MSKPMTDTEAAAVEKRIGRPLTARERMFGELERVDNRTDRERISSEGWQPKMAPPKVATKFDSYVADAEKAADEERFSKMSPAQQRLASAKDLQNKELQAQADAAELRAHIAKHQPQLDKLRALKDSIRLDNSWSAGDVEAINRAISQIEAGPLADAAETAKLFAAPFKILADKTQALRDEAAAQRTELEARIASLNADLAAMGAPALPPELAKLTTAADAWGYYETNFDTKIMENRSPEQQAALEHWIRLDNAEIAAASQQKTDAA